MGGSGGVSCRCTAHALPLSQTQHDSRVCVCVLDIRHVLTPDVWIRLASAYTVAFYKTVLLFFRSSPASGVSHTRQHPGSNFTE